MCRLHGAVASSASSQIAFNGRCGFCSASSPIENIVICYRVIRLSQSRNYWTLRAAPMCHHHTLRYSTLLFNSRSQTRRFCKWYHRVRNAATIASAKRSGLT